MHGMYVLCVYVYVCIYIYILQVHISQQPPLPMIFNFGPTEQSKGIVSRLLGRQLGFTLVWNHWRHWGYFEILSLPAKTGWSVSWQQLLICASPVFIYWTIPKSVSFKATPMSKLRSQPSAKTLERWFNLKPPLTRTFFLPTTCVHLFLPNMHQTSVVRSNGPCMSQSPPSLGRR